MLAPLSWLKEFVDITLKPEQLAERLTEVGLGTEKITKVDSDVIFELEITPNRPDLLCMVGIAREIAAIEGKRIKSPGVIGRHPEGVIEELPIKLVPNFELFERWTGVAVANVQIKPSPAWMQERLVKVGLRPINNIVDITNYIMFELGIPLHAFDYDQIKGHILKVTKAKGGERFTTVDDKIYSLSKNAIIIKDSERVIDLAGIKGGLNSGITDKTTNVFLQTTIDNPVLIRRTSQALSLRSDASAIYERGTDKGGTKNSLARAASLIVELAGGEIASPVIDLKKQNFKPWTVKLNHQRLLKILGIDIAPVKVKSLLERLGLTTNYEQKNHNYTVTIPTYRNDLQIEEDLIEEVARLYGYNNFPKTLPVGQTPTKQIPYFKDYQLEQKVKQTLTACGFSEIYTYSLVSEGDLTQSNFNPDNCLRVDNPVSREFEYLRPSLVINLKKALTQNKPNATDINLFEFGKVYLGKRLDRAQEPYYLSAISNTKNFFEVKGVLEWLFWELGVGQNPTDYIKQQDDYVLFELDFSQLANVVRKTKVYSSIPKHPPIIEDLALVINKNTKIGDIIKTIKSVSPLVWQVSLLDVFENTKTFHIVYQHPQKNLTNDEVSKIRQKIGTRLKQGFGAVLKEYEWGSTLE